MLGASAGSLLLSLLADLSVRGCLLLVPLALLVSLAHTADLNAERHPCGECGGEGDQRHGKPLQVVHCWPSSVAGNTCPHRRHET